MHCKIEKKIFPRRKSMKKVSLILLSLILVLGITACSKDESPAEVTEPSEAAAPAESADQKIVGYCPPSLSDSWLALNAREYESLFTAAGYKFVSSDGQFNISTQMEQMENFAAMGASVVLAQPVNVAAYEPVVKTLRDKGTKVVFIADVPDYDVDGGYLTDEEAIGKMVANMAIAWMDKEYPDAEPGSVHVAALTLRERPSAAIRCDAMLETLKADERVQVVYEKENVSLTPEGLDATKEALALDKDIKLVVSFNDALLIGANSAFLVENDIDKSKVACFGGSYSDAGQQLIDQSETNESVVRGLVSFGDDYFQRMFDLCESALNGDIPVNTFKFSNLIPVNSVGFVSDYDPEQSTIDSVKTVQ
jgi:ABC-type sugar transport system substrate-binding protein